MEQTRYLIEFNTKHEWYTDTLEDAVKDAKALEQEHGPVRVSEIIEKISPDMRIDRTVVKPIDYKLH